MKILLSAIVCVSLIYLSACSRPESARQQAANTDSSYAIIGKVTGLDTGIIILNRRQMGKIDSTALDHGFFRFKGKADTPEVCIISLGEQEKTFFLENGKISMLLKKDSLSDALIAGTKTQDEYNYFQQLSKTVTDRMKKVDNAYDVVNNKKNKKAMDSLDKLYDALSLEQKQLVVHYTKSHPSSFVTTYEIYSNFYYNPRLGQLDSLYQELDTNLRLTYFGRIIGKIIEKERLTAIGKPAPEFSANDANGKPIALSSFKRRYVLIDFWASWCGPCRQENPNVVKSYHKFHDKGFDIFGVSLDHDRVKWLEAVKKDGLDWTQVSDLQGWKATAVSLYGIQGIPMNYLIDKNGIIVAKGLRGEGLDNKLAELLH